MSLVRCIAVVIVLLDTIWSRALTTRSDRGS
jgi:hypothetical protein